VPQNQADYGLSVAYKINERAMTWDTRHDLAACFAWNQVELGFSHSGLKIDGGATRMVHAASSWRLRRGQVKDGRVDAMDCARRCYPYFTVFFKLDHRGNLVI
jgi:hypothetical protein